MNKAKDYEQSNWGAERKLAHNLVAYSERRLAYNDILFASMQFLGTPVKAIGSSDILKRNAVPFNSELMFWYLAIFVAAEAAFIFMAMKEYLQDLIGVPDTALMDIPMWREGVEEVAQKSIPESRESKKASAAS
jgi:hypothetical protein